MLLWESALVVGTGSITDFSLVSLLFTGIDFWGASFAYPVPLLAHRVFINLCGIGMGQIMGCLHV